MDSDDGDTPEINHYRFMAQLQRQREEKRRRHKERQKRAISNIKATKFDGSKRDEDDQSNFASVCLRLAGAVFFLGLGIGALVYSVYKSKSDDQFRTTTTLPPRIVRPFQNFTALKGWYIYERCKSGTPSKGCSEAEVTRLPAQWYQDNQNQRLFVVQGDSSHPSQHRHILAFKNALYNCSLASGQRICTAHCNSNYTYFINSFGIGRHMSYQHSLVMQDYGNIKAWVFSGHNDRGQSVFRYTSPDWTDILYGWQGYPYDDELNINRYEYWFGTNMQQKAPDPSVFDYQNNKCGGGSAQAKDSAEPVPEKKEKVKTGETSAKVGRSSPLLSALTGARLQSPFQARSKTDFVKP